MTWSGPHVDLVCTDRGQHPERVLGIGYIDIGPAWHAGRLDLDTQVVVDLVTAPKDRGRTPRRWKMPIRAPLKLKCQTCGRDLRFAAPDAAGLVERALEGHLARVDLSLL